MAALGAQTWRYSASMHSTIVRGIQQMPDVCHHVVAPAARNTKRRGLNLQAS
jgi:hypothetical protein